MLKNFFFSISMLLAILMIAYFDLIQYGLGQAKGQWKVIRNAVPIEDILVDPSYEDSLKQKIKLIKKVRKFAVEAIGLTNSDNYTALYDQKGEVILWNLSACEAYRFTPKEWSFPLLGSFPYKGFFDLEKAKTEKLKLDKKNYDTRIRPVGGWSTLGWFSDPILSNMLNRSDGGLAELIIHELTHATLFVKDDIIFNENFASFIGERGAIQFLRATYGIASPELQHYLMQLKDEKRFVEYMLYSCTLLEKLYLSIQSLPMLEKEKEKHMLIDEIISSMDTLAFHNDRYYRIFSKSRPNNAYFMSYQRYHSVEDSLNHILVRDYKNDLSSFISGMKEYHE